MIREFTDCLRISDSSHSDLFSHSRDDYTEANENGVLYQSEEHRIDADYLKYNCLIKRMSCQSDEYLLHPRVFDGAGESR